MKDQRKNRKEKFREQTSLFTVTRKPSLSCAPSTPTPTVKAFPIPPDYTDSQKIKDEIELFGFPLRKHLSLANY